MSELSPKAKAFLKAHRDDGTPSEEDAARVRSAVKVAIYGTAVVGSAPLVARLGLLKAGLVSTLVGVASVTAVVAVRSRLAPAPAHPAAVRGVARPVRGVPPPKVNDPVVTPEAAEPPVSPALTAPAAPARAPSGRPVTPPALAQPRSPAPEQTVEIPAEARGPSAPRVEDPPSPPPPAPKAPSFDEELALIEVAQGALRRGDPAAALEALNRRDEAFGETGQLVEEARAARVVALCAAGEQEQARAERAKFIAAHPASLHRDRIERACAGLK